MIQTPTVLIAAAALAAGAAGGYAVALKVAASETAKAESRRMQCEQTRAEEARAAAENTAALLGRAQDAESSAAARMVSQRAAYERKIEETRRDIYRLSTGRECLSGALRLHVNRAIAGDDLPARAGGADPADAATTDDSAVAAWALDVARLYHDCRARIDAIRDWDAMTFGAADGR